MIIEFLGTNGAGKTTTEPLVAQLLDVTYFPGKMRHNAVGEPVSDLESLLNLTRDALTSPLLTMASARIPGPIKYRSRFALDIARSERLARQAHRVGSAVIGNGGLHRLCVAAARTGFEVSRLANRITRAHVYVLLLVDPDEANRRMELRLGRPPRDPSGRVAHAATYVAIARRLTADLGDRMIEVESTETPTMIADQIHKQLSSGRLPSP